MPSNLQASEESTAGIEHVDGLFGYALVLTQNRSDAEDLVQETYVRAIRAMGRLRDDSNVKGWLFTILRNISRSGRITGKQEVRSKN
jgi:RNA polymerase sigma-70 factor, ECF subfamily